MREKIYISGAITGIARLIVASNFAEAVQEINYKGLYIPVDPNKLPHLHNDNWLDYMKEDIQCLMSCAAIYMLKNWRTSKGATIEHDLAKSLGMPVFYQ